MSAETEPELYDHDMGGVHGTHTLKKLEKTKKVHPIMGLCG